MRRGFLKRSYQRQADSQALAATAAVGATVTATATAAALDTTSKTTEKPIAKSRFVVLPSKPENETDEETVEDVKNKMYYYTTVEDLDASPREIFDLATFDAHLPPPALRNLAPPSRFARRKRFVFRAWPRDPDGQPIVPTTRIGKQAPNGLNLWGATLYDFYQVHRIPSCHNLISLSTGSRLAGTMREFGELKWAESEIAWADEEEEPRELFPYDIGLLVKEVERRVNDDWAAKKKRRVKKDRDVVVAERGDTDVKVDGDAKDVDGAKDGGDAIEVDGAKYGGDAIEVDGAKDGGDAIEVNGVKVGVDAIEVDGSKVGGDGKEGGDAKEDEDADGGDVIDRAFAAPRPKGLFDRADFPDPWPLAPFAVPHPKLEKRLPYHRFPKKLIIHDPSLTLLVNKRRRPFSDWTQDITRTYKLELSDEGERRLERSITREKNKKTFIVIESKYVDRNIGPLIVVLAQSGPPEPIPEAHLYITSDQHCGRGNHSEVYTAEWELPRSVLVEEPLCKSCLLEKVDEVIRGREMLASYEPLSTSNAEVYHNASVNSGGDSGGNKDDMDVDTNGVEAEAKVEDSGENKDDMDVDTNGVEAEDASRKKEEEKPQTMISTIQDATVSYCRTYKGPIIAIQPPNGHWMTTEGSVGCSHTPRVPPSVRVKVVAKLSLGDEHLGRETRNYQRFQTHLFQHYSGYNIIPPLHDPVPVCTVLPQFYGYYVPDHSGPGWDNIGAAYASEVLLIEKCGSDTHARGLCVDDKQECASLLFRFHEAGWTHESFAERNVMVQDGPLTVAPDKRAATGVRSFRLIDFGRSVAGTSASRCKEEMGAVKMMGILECLDY